MSNAGPRKSGRTSSEENANLTTGLNANTGESSNVTVAQSSKGKDTIVPRISLPKGGGAIRGIGEKFNVNSATGTGGMSIPIATTPGRSGFGPELSLSYDSGTGNGSFGLGWGLSVPAITRKTGKGLPRYRYGAEEDIFVLSGAEDLVPTMKENGGNWFAEERTDGSYKVQRFRPRVDGTFARIERWTHTTSGDMYWKATTPDNVTSTYGKTSSARISGPENAKHIFTWLLEETSDDRGNVIVYQYKSENMDNVPNTVHEAHRDRTSGDLPNRYLKRILYGNKVMNTVSTSPSDFHFEVVFDYGEHDTDATSENIIWPCRQDPYSTYRSGFEVRTYRLCQRVMMFHRFAELGSSTVGKLVRETSFSYDPNPTLTRLEMVTVTGHSDTSSPLSMPSLMLSYSDVKLDETVRTLDEQSMENLPAGFATAGCQFVDLNGEGAAGVLCEQGGGWTYKPNLGPQWQVDGTAGAAQLGAMRQVAEQPARTPMASGYQLMDLGGDGKLDLVQMSGPMAGYTARTPDGKWEPWRPLKSVPNVNLSSPQVHVVDLTGDGLGDMVVGEDLLFRYYPSKGKEGFDAAEWARKAPDEDSGPQVLSSTGQEVIAFSDMSGDGLSDIVRIRNRNVCYWPNLGYGRFGGKVVMSGVVAMDQGYCFDPQRVKLADIDGSGTIDIIYLHADGPKLYLNQAGNSFSTPQQLSCFPVGDKYRQVQVADILGRGTVQLVWSSPLATDARSPLRYIDLMADGKPHLLEGVDNNMGATTKIHYAPSTRFYLEDKAAGKPWITRMAFPVHVVHQVETWDAVSKSWFASSYRYRHGYFDGHEREFRGFGYVEQRDTTSIGVSTMLDLDASPLNWTPEFNLPPVVTKSWYHTGAWLDRHDISAAMAAEYYSPVSWTAPQLANTELLTELPNGGQAMTVVETRQAYRALKGQLLRKEVYAEDGTTNQTTPYSTVESNAQLRLIQPQLQQKHAVFSVATGESLSMHFERDDSNPRVAHELALKVDEYGNALRSAQVAYPRLGSGPSSNLDPEQQKLWIVVTEQEVFNSPTDATIAPTHTTPYEPETWYRVGVPVESKTYELTLGSNSSLAPSISSPLKIQDLNSEIDTILTSSSPSNVIEYTQQPSETVSQLRIVEHARQIYADNNQSGTQLALGTVESKGLPWCNYALAISPIMLGQNGAYDSRVTDENTMLGTQGGYVKENVAMGDPNGTPADGSWWIPAERQIFDDTGFFQTKSVTDPFGNTTDIIYDPGPEGSSPKYFLAPYRVKSPATTGSETGRNTISATMDYRTMAPCEITDENDNAMSVEFDSLGRVIATAQKGKPDGSGGWEGDTLSSPTTMLNYNLNEWQDNAKPAFMHTKAREGKHNDSNPTWLEQYTYSDGLGREVMTKVEAEPATSGGPARWVGTGRTVYDNKGNPIKKYEPFFSDTSAYEDESSIVQSGVTPIFHYDPLGRVIKTEFPNGTYSKVIFNPWKQESWDENDTIDATNTWYATNIVKEPLSGPSEHPDHRAARLAAEHAGTPTLLHFDTLGRPYLTQQDKGDATTHEYVDTKVVMDVEGLQLVVKDALGHDALTTVYNVMGQPIHTCSIDAGDRWVLLDCMGQELYSWDSVNPCMYTQYDELRRPTHIWVDYDSASEWLLQRLVYGEYHIDAKLSNLVGKLYRHYDGAGLFQADEFDFKGNPTKGSRKLVDYAEFPGIGQDIEEILDWTDFATAVSLAALNTAEGSRFESETFTTKWTYDALNRGVTETIPDNTNTPEDCTVIRNTYNEAGLLEKVDVQVHGAMTALPEPDAPQPIWTPIVKSFDYNAKGQRAQIEYGSASSNGNVETTYTYDEKTFRLTQLHTVRPASPNEDLQELSYAYDAVGNIMQVSDAVQPDVYISNNVVTSDNHYEYDPLYRLISGTGREHKPDTVGVVWCPTDGNLPPTGSSQNPNLLTRYTETFEYDDVGNIESLKHAIVYDGNPHSWTRTYEYEPDPDPANTTPISNKLCQTTVDSNTFAYTHDAHGNMTSMHHLTSMNWNVLDQLHKSVKSGGYPVYYQYDAGGQRVRKHQRNSGVPVEERIYFGSFEIFRDYSSGAVHNERQTIHIMDGQRRVCMIETKTMDGGNVPSPLVPKFRYQLDNHLGTACVELTDAAQVISYEEYHPYGATAYRDFSSTEVSAKRYRYTGKERDEETGLYYHGARYYAAWLGMWTAADPAGMVDGVNLYAYVNGNPISLFDPTGKQANTTTNPVSDFLSKHSNPDGSWKDQEKTFNMLTSSPSLVESLHAEAHKKPGLARDFFNQSIASFQQMGINLAEISALTPGGFAAKDYIGKLSTMGTGEGAQRLQAEFLSKYVARTIELDKKIPIAANLVGVIFAGLLVKMALAKNAATGARVEHSGNSKGDWRDFLPEAQKRLADAKKRYGDAPIYNMAKSDPKIRGYHGANAKEISEIIESGAMKPRGGEVYIGRGDFSATFMHGVDISRKMSFSIEVEVNVAKATAMKHVSTPGVPQTTRILTGDPLPVTVKKLFARSGKAGNFSITTIEGLGNIKRFLSQ